MSILTCVTFRAADDKLPGDVSRNWDQIETIIPKDQTHGVMLDPHDSSVYVIGLKVPLAPEKADFLLTLLHLVLDDRDNKPLIADAACRHLHIDQFRPHYGEGVRPDGPRSAPA